MVTIYKNGTNATLDEVKMGDLFLYGEELYLKTDETDGRTSQVCYNLVDGSRYLVHQEALVRIVKSITVEF